MFAEASSPHSVRLAIRSSWLTTRTAAGIVRKDLGSKAAAELTPQELERWLRSHCKSAATSNRYKAFVSLCYREGMRNGKVNVNPARLVRQRKEGGGRLRFLSHDEYDQLHKVIAERFPEHLAAFIVSVHTGMRLTEQYTTDWSQVDPAPTSFTERCLITCATMYFNVFNHPMFGAPGASEPGYVFDPTFGKIGPGSTTNLRLGHTPALGGQSPLYALGGPRSAQFTVKLQF